MLRKQKNLHNVQFRLKPIFKNKNANIGKKKTANKTKQKNKTKKEKKKVNVTHPRIKMFREIFLKSS